MLIFFGHSTLTMLGIYFSRRHFEVFFLIFPENRLWHLMQIVSEGNHLHEMPNLFSGKKNVDKISSVCRLLN